MDLNHLRSFATVAQLGHLTRAAETLHLSQPAISGHIKALEEQFGVTLFERSPSGMLLTPSGRRLLSETEKIIDAVQQLQHSAQNLRGQPTGRLKIGTVLDPTVLRVGDLLARAFDRYPQIELELNQVLSSDALARTRSGILDASFYFGAEPDADLCSVPLRDMIYRVTMPAEWASELEDAPWETLAERPWIVAPEPSSHRQLVMTLFDDGVSRPTRIIEADSESVISNLVESGVGLSLLRDAVAAHAIEDGLTVTWPGKEITTRLWLVHAQSRAGDPLIAALLDVVHDVWGDADTVVEH
jgi:DNA-binding transcriptional LysR family regulator